MPCSNETKATEVVCLKPDQIPQECPIIDIAFLTDNDQLSWDYEGYTILDTPLKRTQQKLAFTKDKFRNYISGGAIMEVIANTQQPCFGNSKNALILKKEQHEE